MKTVTVEWIKKRKSNKKKANYFTTKGGGSSHVGSPRALKMVYDESNAALEETQIRDFEIARLALHDFRRNALRRERLSFEMWPRADTSTGKNETTCLWERSLMRGAFFSALKLWLRTMFASQGHVNSRTMTSWEWLLTMTISGLRAVTRIWGGMVPPWGAWYPGISEKIVIPSLRCGRIKLIKEERTELWRHVYLPWLSAVEQLERTWASVPILPQNGHLSLTRLPHLFRLSILGRVYQNRHVSINVHNVIQFQFFLWFHIYLPYCLKFKPPFLSASLSSSAWGFKLKNG